MIKYMNERVNKMNEYWGYKKILVKELMKRV